MSEADKIAKSFIKIVGDKDATISRLTEAIKIVAHRRDLLEADLAAARKVIEGVREWIMKEELRPLTEYPCNRGHLRDLREVIKESK